MPLARVPPALSSAWPSLELRGPKPLELIVQNYERLEIRRLAFVAIVCRAEAVLVPIEDARKLATAILELIR